MRPVIIPRAEPGASRSAEKARQCGLEAIVAPLLDMVAINWTPPAADNFDAIVITSANAARAASTYAGLYRELPTYAVGYATAKATNNEGFSVDYIGDGDAQDLIDLAIADGARHLLWLCGERHRAVSTGDASMTALPVYAMRPAGDPQAFTRATLSPAVIMVHSAAIGEEVARRTTQRSHLAIVAISEAAAAVCGDGWCEVAIGAAPRDDAMLELAARLCQKPRGDDATRTPRP